MDSASGEASRWSRVLAAEQTNRQKVVETKPRSGVLGFLSRVLLDLTMSPLQDYSVSGTMFHRRLAAC